MQTDQDIIKVNINDIVPSKYQPRKVFTEDSIKELALSIKNYGILNPLLVRKISSGYEIIAGERRYRAAKMLGLKEVPVIIKDLPDNEVRELALIENIQRNDLNPIEEAEAFKEILSTNNITQEELSTKIGKTQSSISNKMRLLNLSNEVKDAILNGKISERHGRTLLKLTEEEQNQLLTQIINKKLSVKETEELISKKNSKENIKNILNSIDLDTTSSNTFNDTEQKIKEKGEENMNNNTGMGNFFPQLDNLNQNMNSNLNNEPIMFNNSPIENTNILNNEPVPFNNNTTTVPLNTLNQEPAISTIPNLVDNPTTPGIINEHQEMPYNTDINNSPIEPQINIETVSNDNPSMTIPNINIEIETPQQMPQESLNTPSLEINNEPINKNISDMPDKPLFADFNQPTTVSIQEQSQAPTVVESIETPPLDKIKTFISGLNDEHINYKEYNNETESCIIITIKK